MNYRVYDYRDNLQSGKELRIEHTIYLEDIETLKALIELPIEEIEERKAAYEATEQAAYEKVKETAKEWEEAAANVAACTQAIEYLKVPPVQHTSNQWVKKENGWHECSNMVYRMSYQFYERMNGTVIAEWNIYTAPQNVSNIYRVEGVSRRCATREEAEKYIQGRIKAYAHLFAEISPAVPQKYKSAFIVNGVVLPGYKIGV